MAESGKSRPGRTLKDQSDVDRVHNLCAIYTVPEVASAILDRVGWVANVSLRDRRLLEPACGDGAFVIAAVQRLIDSAKRYGYFNERSLISRIVACEFHFATARQVRHQIAAKLRQAGLSTAESARISDQWIVCRDFIVETPEGCFTDVVGNPPYLRWTRIPESLRDLYSERLPHWAARGDLSLAFIWKSYELLDVKSGRIGFLCVDRWLRCAYGAQARERLNRTAHLSTHIDVSEAKVFSSERSVSVSAAISIIEQGKRGGCVYRHARSLGEISAALKEQASRKRPVISALNGRSAAAIASPELVAAMRHLRLKSHLLAAAGISVRCGMALGHQQAFLPDPDVEIERSLLVPWISSSDITRGGITTPSRHVINVWNPDGSLIDLDLFPRCKRHLSTYREKLVRRACVSEVTQWYRTIDKLFPARTEIPRVLVAGLSQRARFGLAPLGAQHSNASYALTSSTWPIEALRGLFSVGVLDLFARILGARFSGGTFRFDGNFLAHVTVPLWSDVKAPLRKKLMRLNDMDVELLLDVYAVREKKHRATISTALAQLPKN